MAVLEAGPERSPDWARASETPTQGVSLFHARNLWHCCRSSCESEETETETGTERGGSESANATKAPADASVMEHEIVYEW
jgi:hypothetical protein